LFIIFNQLKKVIRQTWKIPEIIKAEKLIISLVRCLFNNGENRLFDFVKILKQMEIDPGNVEFTLLENRNFTKFNLHYQTLSWPNIIIEIPD